MGTKIFEFMFNTIRKRANDPNNATFWLPNALNRADNGTGKLLPLHGAEWSLGTITGTAGITFQNAVKGQWWFKVGREHRNDPEMANHQPIPCPNQPWPRLTMREVTVLGLDNVWVLDNLITTQPGSGYHTVMTLQFGYYNGQNGLPALSPLCVKGTYELDQCVCSAPAAGPTTSCDNWVAADNIQGIGTFQSTLTDVYVDATLDVQVAGSGPARTLAVTVDKLTLRGGQNPLPDLTVDELTVETTWTWMSENIWLPQARAALESEDGRQALIQNINDQLNAPANRQSLAAMLTSQLQRILDDTLGTVPAGALPGAAQPVANPADQYLFDRIRLALNNPASDYYLPKVVYGSTDPQLEPDQIDQIALGDQTIGGMPFQNLQFQQVTVTGLSNIAAPVDQLVLNESGLNGTLALSTLVPPPQVSVVRGGVTMMEQVPSPPLTLTGQFSMQPQGDPTTLGGSFTVTVSQSTVLTAVQVSGQDLAELDIQFQQLQLTAASADITVAVQIDSVFQNIVNEVLNQDEIKQAAVQGVNDKAAQDLAAISRTATAGARRLIAARLDG